MRQSLEWAYEEVQKTLWLSDDGSVEIVASASASASEVELVGW